jgi:DNA repair protein RadC
MTTKLSINKWATDERPREKFIEKGAAALSNAELLAILIGSGTAENNAIEIGRNILLECNNNLNNLCMLSYDNLRKHKGIGPGKALSIMSAFELSKRMLLQEASNKIGIYSSQKASKLIMPILQNLNHEEVWVMFLDVANNLISRERVSIGGISASVVDVRIILKKAMEKLCSKIIVAHNHPSHTTRPGENDIMFTKKLKDAAQLCDINLVDHIIIAGSKYFSFADDGIL